MCVKKISAFLFHWFWCILSQAHTYDDDDDDDDDDMIHCQFVECPKHPCKSHALGAILVQSFAEQRYIKKWCTGC